MQTHTSPCTHPQAQPPTPIPDVVTPPRDPTVIPTNPFAPAPPHPPPTPDQQETVDPDTAAAVVLAVSILTELVRNNAINRQAALQAGALASLGNLVHLATGPQGPLCVDVLRCLYVFVSGDNSGYLTPELLEQGTIAALVCGIGMWGVDVIVSWEVCIFSVVYIDTKATITQTA